MKTTIQKWGNSYAMRIPKDLVEVLNVGVGAEFVLKGNKNGVEATLVKNSATKYNLGSLVKKMNTKSAHPIIIDDVPVGKEI